MPWQQYDPHSLGTMNEGMKREGQRLQCLWSPVTHRLCCNRCQLVGSYTSWVLCACSCSIATSCNSDQGECMWLHKIVCTLFTSTAIMACTNAIARRCVSMHNYFFSVVQHVWYLAQCSNPIKHPPLLTVTYCSYGVLQQC